MVVVGGFEARSALDLATLDALMALRRELVADLLLGQVLVVLHACGTAGEVLGLPGRSADVLDAVRVFEHVVDLLERLAGGLREHEEDVDCHGQAEHAEDDVGTPGDVHESWRDEVAEREAAGVQISCRTLWSS